MVYQATEKSLLQILCKVYLIQSVFQVRQDYNPSLFSPFVLVISKYKKDVVFLLSTLGLHFLQNIVDS